MPGFLSRILPAAAAVLILLLTGCESTSPLRGSAVQTEEKQAGQLATRGDYAGAAALYESAAAAASGDQRTHLLLMAAENYLRARDTVSAQAAFAQTTRPPRGDLALHYRIIESELALARSQPQEAERALGPSPSPAAPYRLRLGYYRAQASIQAALRQPAREADARMRLADLASDSAERYTNQQQLLRLLAAMPEAQRSEVRRYGHPHAPGWIALADALAEAGADPLERDLRFRAWRSDYPNHPSARGLEQAPAGAQLPYFAGSATNIGVLLPLTGPYARAAESIQDGVMAAAFSMPAEQRPSVRVYDTGAPGAVLQAYNQATSEGATVVIGPLTKEAVTMLKSAGILSAPVVALNRTDDAFGAATPGLFQFSFSPEEEGRQVAERAMREGFRNPAILQPASGWGARYVEGFSLAWDALGGVAPTVTDYAPEEHHLADPIKSASAGGPDFFYVVGKPLKSRQLRTQIQYFGAADMPVYLTAQAVPSARPSDNLDLDGTRVPAMPWMLPGPDESDDTKGAESGSDASAGETSATGAASSPGDAFTTDGDEDMLQGVREGALLVGEGYGAFYAMGFDAVQIALNLPSLSSGYGIVDGATGRLSVDAAGIVHREPTWITFRRGKPTPLPDL
jgi:outer membrane PBP1 activator LpoA protein